jgi:DNA-binding CsgD family transcriptional regulator
MRAFNVAFFLYILVGFADFYRAFFFLKWEMNVLLMTMYSVGLIIFAYYWLRFAQEFIGVSTKRRAPIILIIGGVSLVSWVAVYLLFMDKEYNLYSVAGKLLGILPDTVFYITLAAYGLRDIISAGKNKDLDNQNRNYFIIVNAMILFNLIWGYLDDIVLVFYPFGAIITELYPFDLNVLIYLLFNLWTGLYLYKKDYFIASSDHGNSVLDTGADSYTLDEIAKRFNLTRREKEMIELVYKGCSNPEISARLNITTGTVKRHIQNIYKKMSIKNRYELIYLIKSE